MHYEEILSQIKAGESPPRSTLDELAAMLRAGLPEGDLYTAIHILGKAGDKRYANVIRPYLAFGLDTDDPESGEMVRRISIQVLARMWRLPEYFDVAARMALEDPSPLPRMAAATAVGFLGGEFDRLRNKAATVLSRGLDSEQDRTAWESFHMGLLELFKVPTQDWPLASRSLREQDIRRDLIQRAHEIASSD